MVHFRLDATTVDSGDTAANAVGRFNQRASVRMGATVQIAVATENVHFFDHDTRKAIWD